MASKELEVYDKFGDAGAAIKHLGNSIAMSKMFGCENVAQGEVLAMECLAQRKPPLSLVRKYHIIFNRLSQKADDMHSEFLLAGGKSEIVDRSPARCAVKLTLGNQVREFSLTWEEALAEPFVYEGKESAILELLAAGKKPTLKAKYSTPRSRMQMLWARVISDAIRAMAPHVNAGCYTPEEMTDVEEGVHANGNGNGKHAPPLTAEQAMQQAAAKAAETTGEPIDAEFTIVPDAKVDAAQPATTTATQHPANCTAEQRQQLGQLWDTLSATDEQRQKQLAKRGVTKARDLTEAQAADLIAKLEAAKSQQINQVAGESTQTTAKQSVSIYEPCSQVLVDEIKKILLSSDAKGIVAPVKEHLAKFGKTKLAELSTVDAEALKQALVIRNLEAFFGRSLLSPEVTTSKN